MQRRRWAWLVPIGAALLITSCGGSGSHLDRNHPQNRPVATNKHAGASNTADTAPGDDGTLAGTLGIYGGLETAHHCGCFIVPGTLRLTNRQGKVRHAEVGKSGRFAVALPAGDYRVVGGLKAPKYDWPMGSCVPFSPTSAGRHLTAASYFHVSKSRVTRVHIGCIGQ